ncbi:DUF4258 domain-containing protein [Bradyrhizobium diazoefficiens]|nr:DUF4258 domain-containing protein [Bradyrhizobium diazoefficiens]MBR0847101.1 DUF4258 domain-containing protein [Bradyrhizobium diazoefficiens]
MAQVLPLVKRPQPWKPADATDEIRRLARCDDLKLTYRQHARDQMTDRDLFMSDVMYVLKNGFVYQDGKISTRPGFYKYRSECFTPNSNGREVGVVVCPDSQQCWMKIITVMWIDEY